MILIQPGAAQQSLIGGTAGSVPVNLPSSTPQSATAVANTQVQITIANAFGASVRLTELSFSYSAAPTAGSILVTSNAVTIYQAAVTVAGLVTVPLPDGGLEGAQGQTMVITLAAAGAAVVGSLNVASYYGS